MLGSTDYFHQVCQQCLYFSPSFPTCWDGRVYGEQLGAYVIQIVHSCIYMRGSSFLLACVCVWITVSPNIITRGWKCQSSIVHDFFSYIANSTRLHENETLKHWNCLVRLGTAKWSGPGQINILPSVHFYEATEYLWMSPTFRVNRCLQFIVNRIL